MNAIETSSMQFTFKVAAALRSPRSLGLTSQRIGQIYYAALRSLANHPKNPFNLDD